MKNIHRIPISLLCEGFAFYSIAFFFIKNCNSNICSKHKIKEHTSNNVFNTFRFICTYDRLNIYLKHLNAYQYIKC